VTDKKLENELAQQLLIAIASLQDRHGRYLGIRLADDPMTNTRLAKDVAEALVAHGWTRNK
jgi:hypothetical protein